MATEPEQIIDNPDNDPNEVQAAPEGEQPTEPVEEKRVPLAALKEARAQKKQLASELDEARAQLAQLNNYIRQLPQMGVQHTQPQYDPELKALIAPVLEEYLTPMQAKLAATEAALSQERSLRTMEQKMSYIQKNIPFLDDEDFKEEFAAAIEDMSQDERDAFENSPVAIVKLAHAIRGTAAPKSNVAKAAAKAAAKSVSGASPASKHGNVTGVKNAMEMSSEEFRKAYPDFFK